MIVKAAIRTDDGIVYSLDPPNRHHDIIALIRKAGYVGPVGSNRQGFLDDSGNFLDRLSALDVAITAKQVDLKNCHAPRIGLFSEDLW